MSATIRLGAFLIGGLLILATGVFLIGSKEFLFESTYLLKAEYPNVAGLVEGAEVRVGGVREGTVKRIILPATQDQKVVVEMEMHSPTRSILKKDSVASIKSEGLLGDKYIEVSFGSSQAGPLHNGDTVNGAPPVDIADLIDKTNQILNSTQDVLENADLTSRNLTSISAKINNGQGTAGALINDKSMYQQATAGAAAFKEDMEALQHNFLLRGYFKKHAFESPDELSKHAIARLPNTAPMQRFSYDAQATFSKPGTTKLKNPKMLNEAGSFLEGHQFGIAVVTASTGMTGDSDEDRLLTEQECAAIRDYLVQNFRLDDTRIKTLGLGKAKDAADSGKIEILVYQLGDRR